MQAFVLAQAASGQYVQLIMMGAIFVVFYLFMIRPQQQKGKEQKKFIETLEIGDKVVTTGGIHGKVIAMTDLTVVLEIDRGFKITFDRAAVSMESSKRVQKEEGGSTSPKLIK